MTDQEDQAAAAEAARGEMPACQCDCGCIYPLRSRISIARAKCFACRGGCHMGGEPLTEGE